MNIKNIIFDVGGVLADPKSGHWFITNNFFSIVDKEIIEESKLANSLKKNLYLQTQKPKTELEEHKMFSDYYYKVLKDIEYPNLTKDIADKIADDCVYNDEKFIFYDDVKLSLEKLSKDHDLYIISNGWPSSLRVIKNVGIDKYFKGIMISSMFNKTKEETLFDLFLEKYNINPKESIFIDDRRHILTKANEYGFKLLLMDRKNKYDKSDFKIINSLKELDNIKMNIGDL